MHESITSSSFEGANDFHISHSTFNNVAGHQINKYSTRTFEGHTHNHNLSTGVLNSASGRAIMHANIHAPALRDGTERRASLFDEDRLRAESRSSGWSANSPSDVSVGNLDETGRDTREPAPSSTGRKRKGKKAGTGTINDNRGGAFHQASGHSTSVYGKVDQETVAQLDALARQRAEQSRSKPHPKTRTININTYGTFHSSNQYSKMAVASVGPPVSRESSSTTEKKNEDLDKEKLDDYYESDGSDDLCMTTINRNIGGGEFISSSDYAVVYVDAPSPPPSPKHPENCKCDECLPVTAEIVTHGVRAMQRESQNSMQPPFSTFEPTHAEIRLPGSFPETAAPSNVHTPPSYYRQQTRAPRSRAPASPWSSPFQPPCHEAFTVPPHPSFNHIIPTDPLQFLNAGKKALASLKKQIATGSEQDLDRMFGIDRSQISPRHPRIHDDPDVNPATIDTRYRPTTQTVTAAPKSDTVNRGMDETPPLEFTGFSSTTVVAVSAPAEELAAISRVEVDIDSSLESVGQKNSPKGKGKERMSWGGLKQALGLNRKSDSV